MEPTRVNVAVSAIERACLAKLDEVMQKLAGSISEPEMERLAGTLRKVVTASLQLETTASLSALLTIENADVADLRDLRLIAAALADRLRGISGTNLKALAALLGEIMDRAEIAAAMPAKPGKEAAAHG